MDSARAPDASEDRVPLGELCAPNRMDGRSAHSRGVSGRKEEPYFFTSNSKQPCVIPGGARLRPAGRGCRGSQELRPPDGKHCTPASLVPGSRCCEK